MALDIYWTDFAKQELHSIFSYHKKHISVKFANKLVSEIATHSLILKTHPNIGQPEELLKNRIQKFRYLVYKNYKIIYWINREKNQVEISDIFDIRQNPIKIKRDK